MTTFGKCVFSLACETSDRNKQSPALDIGFKPCSRHCMRTSLFTAPRRSERTSFLEVSRLEGDTCQARFDSIYFKFSISLGIILCVHNEGCFSVTKKHCSAGACDEYLSLGDRVMFRVFNVLLKTVASLAAFNVCASI